jgi:hypothetical protein
VPGAALPAAAALAEDAREAEEHDGGGSDVDAPAREGVATVAAGQ